MKLKALVLALLFGLAQNALALGLGPAELKSRIGEPLDITIAVLDSGDLGVDDLQLKQRLDAGFGDGKPYQFKLLENSGALVIEVHSREPVTEPYVSFVLEVQLPNGRVSREYTLMLDF